jgi:uncharacterized membrane protein YkvA (DUF1232 family)
VIGLDSLRSRARRLKLEVLALYFAARHPCTPWYAKLVIAGCVAYAVTPADIIPDVLPIFGWVDDLLFIPIAVALAAGAWLGLLAAAVLWNLR